MIPLEEILQKINEGGFDAELGKVYAADAEMMRSSVANVVKDWKDTFASDSNSGHPVAVFSAPGRTEIGGNHTDHEHGCVLAAAVDTDIIACAGANGTDKVRFLSKGWPMLEIDLGCTEPMENEKETTSSLIRGIAARIMEMGYPVAGFDACAVSTVLPGSGLSSSAAFEVVVGVIINHLFCGDKLTDVEIAQIGQYAENHFFGKPSGLMDQMASSVGGAVAIDFKDPAKPSIERVSVDLASYGYALCIIDSGASHAELTSEYAAIPEEMKKVAGLFGKTVLRDVDEDEFWKSIPMAREKAGDRAVLRAMHFFEDNRRARKEAEALKAGDFNGFLELINESGRSSWMYLQNICPAKSIAHQEMGVALAVAEYALNGKGACRVHGGGFAGTIQVFVPIDMLNDFNRCIDGTLGKGHCQMLSIRDKGGVVIFG